MIKIASSVLRYAVAALLIWYISLGLNIFLTDLYRDFFPSKGGGFDIDLVGTGIFILSLEFLVPFWVVSLGDRFRYWVAGLVVFAVLVPALLTSSQYLYEDLICIFAGFLLGWLLRYLISQTLGKMPSLEPMKKYF